MPSPQEQFPEPDFMKTTSRQRSSEEEGTIFEEGPPQRPEHPHHLSDGRKTLRLDTSHNRTESLRNMKSPSQTREQAHRLEDDLRMLQVERAISRIDEKPENELDVTGNASLRRERSRPSEIIDEFDVATNPLHEKTQLYSPPAHPTTAFSKFVKSVHQSNILIRYFTYIMPITLVLLIPLLIGALLPTARKNNSNVGGVALPWFFIWLEIVWLTLWAGRILAKALPWPCGFFASLFTNNSKKWRDMVKQLEVSATLFFWLLGIEISFLPTMKNHHVNGNKATKPWETTLNKILISFLVAAALNFVEKIIIQLIAISFHERTYQDRIELNKFQIGSLTKLYTFSKVKLEMEDSDFEGPAHGSGPGSGARTPAQYLEKAQKGTKQVLNKFGDVAGKIAGDFTGKAVKQSSHPSQVILTLLNSTSGSQVLARRLYRTFAREETETVHQDDLMNAFENQDECDAAFTMFDKDMNGDISMEELEAVCVEIGRERKAITASLKDLDSVVGKFDDCLTFLVLLISVLVLISLISTSAAGVLTSAGSTVLALSWLLQATAQEFLQSLIFVFVKHPFDVGDRITIYGNTGATLKGDDYFVKEISLLYTEFKKMEGHVVQAPNSYLNTLFILNMRRSGGLAEAVPMSFKFGTTLEQIDGLRLKLLEFVKAEKREYQANILTELRDIVEAHSITLNVIFFFKSNWQNEGLRLQRRNKFICAVMVAMQELGIEGPRMRYPGQKETFPLYMQNIPFQAENLGRGGTPDNPDGLDLGLTSVVEEEEPPETGSPEETRTQTDNGSRTRSVRPRGESILSNRPRGESILGRPTRLDSIARRPRGESIAQLTKRFDLSLGMEAISSADYAGDVYQDRQPRHQIPISVTSPSRSREPPTSKERRDSRQSDAQGIARTTSRSATFNSVSGMLQRVGTNGTLGGGGKRGSVSSTHRNRFMPFGRKSTESERMMESGMAGIPEHVPNMPTVPPTAASVADFDVDDTVVRFGSASSSSAAAVASAVIARPQTTLQRIDPRTGLISPRAVRANTEESAVSAGSNVAPPEMTTTNTATSMGAVSALYRQVSPLTVVSSGGSRFAGRGAGAGDVELRDLKEEDEGENGVGGQGVAGGRGS